MTVTMSIEVGDEIGSQRCRSSPCRPDAGLRCEGFSDRRRRREGRHESGGVEQVQEQSAPRAAGSGSV